MFGRKRTVLLGTAMAALTLLLPSPTARPGHAETVLCIAMTAADLPDWRGQPDQGFEGYRHSAIRSTIRSSAGISQAVRKKPLSSPLWQPEWTEDPANDNANLQTSSGREISL